MYPKSYREAVNRGDIPLPKSEAPVEPPDSSAHMSWDVSGEKEAVTKALDPLAEPYVSWEVQRARNTVDDVCKGLTTAHMLYIYRTETDKAVMKEMCEVVIKEVQTCLADGKYQRIVEVFISLARVMARRMSGEWVMKEAWDSPADNLLQLIKLSALTCLRMCPQEQFAMYEASILLTGAWNLYPSLQ